MENAIYQIAISMPAFLLAIVFHEWAHALIALRYGDKTALSMGRLTLNPIPHIDILGTIILPIVGAVSGGIMFGWAKPVPIDPRQFRDVRMGIFWVSFAGPLMNMLLATLCAFLFVLAILKMPTEFYLYKPLIAMLRQSIYINLMLAVFNLIPLPPLDGSKMVSTFLSYEAMRKYEVIENYSFFIFLGLMFTGAISFLLRPALYLAQGLISIFYMLLA